MSSVEIGIIGGSGLYAMPGLTEVRELSHPKGHHQRYTLLSDNLLTVLRDYYRQARPKSSAPRSGFVQPVSGANGGGRTLFAVS